MNVPICIAQINPKIGDLEGNYALAKDAVAEFKRVFARNGSDGFQIVVFPELSVCGYPPKDLLDRPPFVSAVIAMAEKWAALSDEKTAIIFGSVVRDNSIEAKRLHNVAHVAFGGKIVATQAKTLLPTYDVFDEDRYFSPWKHGHKVIRLLGLRIGLTICEDTWNDRTFWQERLYEIDPVEQLIDKGVDLMINISASPFSVGKPAIREKMLSHLSARNCVPFVYVNQVGGNDDVVYDGRSMAFDWRGNLVLRCDPYREHLAYFTIATDADTAQVLSLVTSPLMGDDEDIFNALVLGTKDYARKTGFKTAILGLSGGIDSALVACVAATALGPKNVTGVAMPSRFSSGGSVTDAEALARTLGINFEIIPIRDVHSAYMGTLTEDHQRDAAGGLVTYEAPIPQEFDPFGPRSIAERDKVKVELWEENLQARIRGVLLMSLSNKFNHLLLTTGNKSEISVGYCTLYGDTCGGLAVISDLYKTRVYSQSRYFNKLAGKEIIPESTITKPPSAELRPDQKDQDSLPPYDVLDEMLQLYLEEGMDVKEINREMRNEHGQLLDIKRWLTTVDLAEYKRGQMAPGIKITKKAFGSGRVLPIAQGWKH